MSNSQFIYYNTFLRSNNIKSYQLDYYVFIQIINDVKNLYELKKEFSNNNIRLKKKKLNNILDNNIADSFFAEYIDTFENSIVYIKKNDDDLFSIFQNNGKSFKMNKEQVLELFNNEIYLVCKRDFSLKNLNILLIINIFSLLIYSIIFNNLLNILYLFYSIFGLYSLGIYNFLKNNNHKQIEFPKIKLFELCLYVMCLMFSIFHIDFLFHFLYVSILIFYNLFFYNRENLTRILYNLFFLILVFICFNENIFFEYEKTLLSILICLLIYISTSYINKQIYINNIFNTKIKTLKNFYFNPNLFGKMLKYNIIEKFEFEFKKSFFKLGSESSKNNNIKIVLDFYSSKSELYYTNLLDFIINNQNNYRFDFFFICDKESSEFKILQRLAQLYEYGEMNFLKALTEWFAFKDREIWFLEFGEPYQIENYFKKLEYQEHFLKINNIIEPCLIINESFFPEEFKIYDIEKLLNH